MRLTDLTPEYAEIVRGARSTIEFKARFWGWLERHRGEGPLVPLLSDMERHWGAIGEAPALSEAREVLRQIGSGGRDERVRAIGERYREVTGTLPDVEVILFAGLERPEGYSRFDRGGNTIFVGLDHPTSLAHADHLELILSHELCHAVRDPWPAVLADYGGAPQMSHDDFVARHPFREHLVSESLATSVSELAHPGRPDRRYVYFEEEAVRWCEEHRREIAERLVQALERGEPYRTFYAEGSITPDSPDCCDYWFGLHLGRFAHGRAPAAELLRQPATEYLERYLDPFLAVFLAERPRRETVAVTAPRRRRATQERAAALEGASLPRPVRRAYEDYAELLQRRPGLARTLEEQFAQTITDEKLEHGGEPWPVHAFPLLLSADELRHLRWAADGLLRLIERAIELYRADREVRAFFHFPHLLDELCRLEPGFRPHVMLGRFDSYWSGRRLRFLELNVNGAAMWPLAEVLGRHALELPSLREVLDRHGASSSPLTSRMLEGLLHAWRQVRGASEPRRIAIVDWVGVRTVSEQERLARDFTRMGVPADVVAPSALRFDGRELHGPHGPIDLVLRRLTTLDLIERHGELGALLDAARAGAVVTVGSFASDVAHSKRLFAFLTHERWERRFSPEERSLIDAHVPWTRLFVPGRTQYEGRLRELSELALAARERFVLKPAEGYEGQGVLLGAETDPALWRAEVERRYGGPHIIQEVVQAPLRTLLVPHAGRVEEVSRWLHLGQFVIQGQMAGLIARCSEELVLSARSEERAMPTLVLEDQEDELPDGDLGPATP